MVNQTAWAQVTQVYGGDAVEAYFVHCVEIGEEPTADGFRKSYRGSRWVAEADGLRKEFMFV